MRLIYCGLLLLMSWPLYGSAKRSTLYASLDPRSIPQQLAFCELYPDTPEGERALQRAWELLAGPQEQHEDNVGLADTALSLTSLVDRFTRLDVEFGCELPKAQLDLIQRLAKGLAHRQLAGHQAWSVDEIVALPPEEIDFCRALLLTCLGDDPSRHLQILSYEALIDLMALQILTRTTIDAPPVDKINAINWFLFHHTGLRFPPHSRYAEDIDVYTFLPSVLDKRRGVCLGVSCLYLCLGQRLELPLEAVTPPGHIYVRYVDKDREINIETTARGIHLSSDEYLGVQTRELQTRNIKEVVGLTFMNQGAALWQANQTQAAITAYRTALQFLPEDALVNEFLGYNLLVAGDLEEGRARLQLAREAVEPHALRPSTAVEDLLDNQTDIEGIQAIFMPVDETRESILAKQAQIKSVLERHPSFRQGWFHLAVTWLQLGREHEALGALERYHQLDCEDPVVEYYISAVSLERHDYHRAWDHLQLAEALAENYEYAPHALRDLRRQLKQHAPE